jgi:type IV pilus assembly protein PilM
MSSIASRKLNQADGAWGIDLGLESLKAVRMTLDSASGVPTINALVRVRYPVASPQGLDWSERLTVSLSSLLQQHDPEEDPVAVSVPDLWGLLSYSKIPAVDDERVHDVVCYEAPMQIPVPMEEVVWDYQCFPNTKSNMEESFVMQSLALVAVKGEHLQQILLAFQRLRFPLDVVQVRSVALANLAFHEGIAGNPEKPVGLLDIGSDESWMTAVSGVRVVRHRFSVGIEDVTRALAEKLSLPPVSAERLRRNLQPRSLTREVLTALKPPYAALAEQAAKALGLCLKNAPCHSLILLGDGSRLPLLDKVLRSMIGCPVQAIEPFSRIKLEAELLDAKIARGVESMFAPACGLALQAIGLGTWVTNLLPPEFRTQRASTASAGGIMSWFGRKRRPQ